jgi:hypothetical protein
VTARVRDVLQSHPELLGEQLSDEDAQRLRDEFVQLRRDADEFRTLSELVPSMRELVGEEGATKLGAHFEKLAKRANEQFRWWATGLAVATILGGAGLVLVVAAIRPEGDASNAEIVSRALLDILIVGLVIFVIRFVAMQARAYRHVEFVARNKANALSTFNLIVTGQKDQEVRAQVASALAQAVFKSDDGIFADASSDTVTIVERIVGSVGSRTTAP